MLIPLKLFLANYPIQSIKEIKKKRERSLGRFPFIKIGEKKVYTRLD